MYNWYPAIGLSKTTGSSVVASPDTTTTYTVTGISADGCISKAIVTIMVSPLPVIITSQDTGICPGEQVCLRAKGGQRFTWYTKEGLIGTGDSLVCSPDRTTTFYVEGTNSNGCSSTTQVTVRVKELSFPEDKTICLGDSVTLSASLGYESYRWEPAIGLTTTFGRTVKTRPDATTTYTLTASMGVCTMQKNVTVTVASLPKVSLGSDQLICSGETILLHATPGNAQYNWLRKMEEQWQEIAASDSILEVTEPGFYRVVVQNVAGCMVTDSIQLNYCEKLSDKYPLFIPNIITPNGDQVNDRWEIPNLEKFGKNELVIYNRWGKEVHRMHNYCNTWNGEGLENGVYYYWLKVERENRLLKGWVQILR
jgi:gliding motility-associated-like protein